MFTVSVRIKAETKAVTVRDAEAALWQLRALRDCYNVEPDVSDGANTFTEADLIAMQSGQAKRG